MLFKVLQKSNFVVFKTETDHVIEKYMRRMEIKDRITLNLRQAITLELSHVQTLMNKYAVTDKIDGERHALFICDNNVYLISNTLAVKNTGIKLSKEMTKYDGSILDGEYVFIQKYNRFVYFIFDCLFLGEIEVKKIASFNDRLRYADELINDCFVTGKQKGFKFLDYDGKFDIHKIIDYHEKQTQNFFDMLNSDLQIDKKYPLIRRKYVISALGANSCEIFAYANFIWKKFVDAPYSLDGVVFHPLEQIYVTRDIKLHEYKWKPPEKNSIDFYITYELNKRTGKPLIVFDNSQSTPNDEIKVRDKPYVICKLNVSRKVGRDEKPELFKPDGIDESIVHLYLQDGKIKDIEGNTIHDMSVVEFYYNNDLNVDKVLRWVPIKTRHDKTTYVMALGKRFGNVEEIAYRNWRSILNPVTIGDFELLSNPDLYKTQLDYVKLREKVAIQTRVENDTVYYQLSTTLAKPMREFHNWIKSNLIHTYCSPSYISRTATKATSKNIIDYSIGRGGDIMKFYHANVSLLVGIDVDAVGIESKIDGAKSRYDEMKKAHPDMAPMFFVHGDSTLPFDIDKQVKKFGNSTNKEIWEHFFSQEKKQKFDVGNCQFTIHYFLENEKKWNNWCENVNNTINKNGYLIISTFDGKLIDKLFKDNERYTLYYTNSYGEKKILFEVVKKYEGVPNGCGYAIDVHNAFFSKEGTYIREYIVDPDYLIKSMTDKCGMTLIESDTFGHQFDIHKEYLTSRSSYDVRKKSIKNTVGEYYDRTNEINVECYNITKLNRFYVFKKF